MLAQIINAGTASLEEFYMNKNCMNLAAYSTRVDFGYDITPPANDIRSFTVLTSYMVKNLDNELMSLLKTKSIFDIKGIFASTDSLNVLEQAVYIAFSEMLKHHKEKYKHWKAILEDIAMPDDAVIVNSINRMLSSLPY